eukprot:CAMPEP_0173274650 /NCGR_PEP_ID=MMETSP1143-20121109/2556_1 /TAXON_ID=483371 /ORGANISM="non described non described, Strain CCMP2298" /LENGTH=282 /DNA_ID=CAMNT_0014211481 /DNA_START=32 /DNA_END=876 /DNA_ORIENTATION=+
MAGIGLEGSWEDNGTLDEQMKAMYGDTTDLEARCTATAYADTAPPDTPDAPDAPHTPSTPLPEPVTNLGMTACYEKSPQAVIDALPKGYFLAGHDPVEPLLLEISSWQREGMMQRCLNRIEEADTDKDVIVSYLTAMIDANYAELMQCMRSVQDIDVDLCRAGIQLGHGRQKLRSACTIIHSGAITVQQLHAKRGKLTKVAETVRSLQALKDIHQAMLTSIGMGEVGRAARHAQSVLDCLSRSFGHFHSLKSIGQSALKAVVTIRRKSDKALRRLCGRKFST